MSNLSRVRIKVPKGTFIWRGFFARICDYGDSALLYLLLKEGLAKS